MKFEMINITNLFFIWHLLQIKLLSNPLYNRLKADNEANTLLHLKQMVNSSRLLHLKQMVNSSRLLHFSCILLSWQYEANPAVNWVHCNNSCISLIAFQQIPCTHIKHSTSAVFDDAHLEVTDLLIAAAQ